MSGKDQVRALQGEVKRLEKHLEEHGLLIESLEQESESAVALIGKLSDQVEEQDHLLLRVFGRLQRALTEDLAGAHEQISLAHGWIRTYFAGKRGSNER